MGIDTSKNKIINSTGFTRKVFLLAPFVQLLLWLNSLEPFLFWGLHRFFIDFIILVILSIALYLLLKVFFLIAKRWQKWVMYVYLSFFVLQTGIGLIYKYYEPHLEEFTKKEIDAINDYFAKKDTLPENMELLLSNDSLCIVGKKTLKKVRSFRVKYNKFKSNGTNSISKCDYFLKFTPPKDFCHFAKLVNFKDSLYVHTNEYWSWQFPEWFIYIYIKKCTCESYKQDNEPCFVLFNEGFNVSRDCFDPILEEIFECKLDDRYRNFYKFFKKLANPTYVRTDLANDPYFLIYQGKYKEAREGLKDLPPARREFCEKKLEALGY